MRRRDGRLRAWRANRFAAWLAGLALAVQSLLPLVLAVEIEAAPIEAAAPQLPAPATAHPSHSGHGDHRPGDAPRGGGGHAHAVCPICYCLGVAKIFTAPPGFELARPAAARAAPAAAPIAESHRPVASPASYSPRAPPSAG